MRYKLFFNSARKRIRKTSVLSYNNIGVSYKFYDEKNYSNLKTKAQTEYFF